LGKRIAKIPLAEVISLHNKKFFIYQQLKNKPGPFVKEKL